MEEELYHTFFEVEKKHWWFAARGIILRDLIHRHLVLPRGASVLDVGCGTGAILEMLSESFEAYGTDSSPLAIKYCRSRGLRNVVRSTLDSSPFPGKKFDLITFLDVIEHLDEDRKALIQARRLLKPGGRVLITVPAYQWLWSQHDEINHHKRRYEKATLRAALTGAGFNILRISFFNSILFPAALVQRLVAGPSSDMALKIPPAPINALLREVFAMERFLLRSFNFPFGLSLLAVAIPASKSQF